MAMQLHTLVCLLVLVPTNANPFLGRTDQRNMELDMKQRQAILAELEQALGSDHRQRMEPRIVDIEQALKPTFTALPKVTTGAVGPSAARYALHRLFVQRHGWQMKGLEPGGESWSGGSPTAVFGPFDERVRSLFDQRLGSGGLTLHELSVLAATLEHLVHSESSGRLRATYAVLNISETEVLDETRVVHVLETYMAHYVLGANFSIMTAESVEKLANSINEQYPNWPETKKFLHGIQQEVSQGRELYSFPDVAAIVDEVGERYGRWQTHECTDLKKELLQIEESNGTGRVRLADFYHSAVHAGKWQFSESADYLRQLGSLDESEPEVPRVIIANYINAPSNCIASSGYYGVCCIDECEDLFAHLEVGLGVPSASPEDILRIVSALPSASMPGNRSLPTALVKRLGEVAHHHGGRVPLHGRLFAQWMHHAYPHECTYPHISGTTSPRRAEQYEAETGLDIIASHEEMVQYMEAGRSSSSTSRQRKQQLEEGMCSTMWTMEEELVDPEGHQSHHTAGVARGGETTVTPKAVLRGIAFAAILGSALVALARLLAPVFVAMEDSPASSGTKVYNV